MSSKANGTETKTTIGSRIRGLRIGAGMTQTELAERLHISNKSCLSNYENDRREVPMQVVVELADCLRTSTDYILRGSTGKDPYLAEMEDIFRQFDTEQQKKAAIAHLKTILECGM